ncbi:MAG: MFS transporter [Proteobacteria bacterium]|nr:MFS transporter [Pseudomonadota bacterium]
MNLQQFKRPEILLMLMAAAVPLSFSVWMTLLDNFAIERVHFTGREIGILQSLREIPGFMAFAVVFVLLIVKEQALAYLSLLLLGIGTFITGWFPSVLGLYATTVLMSIGFHYYETMQTSLSLQWLGKKEAPHVLGKIIAVGSFTSLIIYGLLALATRVWEVEYSTIYMAGGGATISIALFCWWVFPHYPEKVAQHKKIILRKRYWLYYALVFMSGARRQIFIVFAGFLMVEKFGYSVGQISTLFLINAGLNMFLAPKIGRLIGFIGERHALVFEYLGLICIFSAYAFVSDHRYAAGLYVLDHLFFAMAIAIKTYFQKIADPKDISSTAAVGFTINHIAAVVLPAVLGLIWIQSHSLVFLIGAGMALISLLLALIIPRHPEPGREVVFKALDSPVKV